MGFFKSLSNLFATETAKPQPTAKTEAAPNMNEKRQMHNVTGISHYTNNILKLATKNPAYALSKKEIIAKKLCDQKIFEYTFAPKKTELIPEPTNQHDPNAIKVVIDGQTTELPVLNLTKSEAKEILAIPEDKRVISILSGGAGCGKIIKICRLMNKRLDSSHVICVFSGKNEKLKEKIEKEFGNSDKVKVISFTPDVNIYIKASDVTLSKPGGLSSTEVAAVRCPLVHLKAIPGCESYNIKYFTENGLSLPGKSVRSAVAQTERLLSDARLAEDIKTAQERLIQNYSAELIANKIIEGNK